MAIDKSTVLELIMLEVSNSRAHRGRVVPIGDARIFLSTLLDEFERSVIEQNKIVETIAIKTVVEG